MSFDALIEDAVEHANVAEAQERARAEEEEYATTREAAMLARALEDKAQHDAHDAEFAAGEELPPSPTPRQSIAAAAAGEFHGEGVGWGDARAAELARAAVESIVAVSLRASAEGVPGQVARLFAAEREAEHARRAAASAAGMQRTTEAAARAALGDDEDLEVEMGRGRAEKARVAAEAAAAAGGSAEGAMAAVAKLRALVFGRGGGPSAAEASQSVAAALGDPVL